jgi:type IV pilus assembly protein PilN
MIKINLLQAERKAARKKLPFQVGSVGQVGQKLTVVCSLILIGMAVAIGWRFWSIGRESAQLDQDISSAQQETARLHSLIQQVQEFEQRRAQLQERVALIEELRKSQTGPVHMLDQISRAMPEMLWLVSLKQSAADANEVLIDGRTTTHTSVSDFVANLEASGYFKRSVEIVQDQIETITGPPGELVRFQLRAIFQQPGSPPALPINPAAKKGN